jgi:hypothetical protein
LLHKVFLIILAAVDVALELEQDDPFSGEALFLASHEHDPQHLQVSARCAVRSHVSAPWSKGCTRIGSLGDKLICHVARLRMFIMLVSMNGGLMMDLLKKDCTPSALWHSGTL